ncbi:OmpA family protein [Caenispirillum bisanense]|uniref:OmpA-OmpF porin, OOP family n=1 Tax=Caenispirillum bisanense TaxID=414052 RepID=A0A286GJ36_9PROT|nr:OmpA family protein [Caenispirillum bisanense]SOD95236.1 OmpA-OmpF porin, OOP family [Caenispirillum bisanense]
MHTFMKIALPASAVLALTACASGAKIENAKAVAPSGGSAFTQELAKDYGDYTRFEADEMYDWPDADHFADKALAAAEGKRVAPENPEEWDIEREDWMAELKQARATLVGAYQDGFREDNPQAAASAQANYDCWVEQAEEGWQYDHIAKCREGFLAAMQQRGGEVVTQVEGPPPVLVFFDWDVARLPAEATQMLDAMANVAQDNPQMRLNVTGHADTSGPSDYNVGLSRERAENVASALQTRGVARDRMIVDWKGESDPRVPTGDGVREPENRRVTIQGTGTAPMASMDGMNTGMGAGGMQQSSMAAGGESGMTGATMGSTGTATTMR